MQTILTYSECKELLNGGINREALAAYPRTAKALLDDNFSVYAISEIIDNIANDNEDFEIRDDNAEYRFLRSDIADSKAIEYIKDLVWAFNPDFIVQHSKAFDYDNASLKIIEAIQAQCENGNEAMLRLIDDFVDFADDAIAADGRGHFLSAYDGKERDLYAPYENSYFYYRIN